VHVEAEAILHGGLAAYHSWIIRLSPPPPSLSTAEKNPVSRKATQKQAEAVWKEGVLLMVLERAYF